MKKQITIIAVLAVVAVASIAGSTLFDGGKANLSRSLELSLPSFALSSFNLPTVDDATASLEAWTAFQQYLEFARTHNLLGIKSLSYQLSQPCSDPAREKECFDIMDGVYVLSMALKPTDFTHVLHDRKQTILYTDGNIVAILYFVRGEDKSLKVLGLRYCAKDEANATSCSKIITTEDTDKDGWWDSTQSLFSAK